MMGSKQDCLPARPTHQIRMRRSLAAVQYLQSVQLGVQVGQQECQLRHPLFGFIEADVQLLRHPDFDQLPLGAVVPLQRAAYEANTIE